MPCLGHSFLYMVFNIVYAIYLLTFAAHLML